MSTKKLTNIRLGKVGESIELRLSFEEDNVNVYIPLGLTKNEVANRFQELATVLYREYYKKEEGEEE